MADSAAAAPPQGFLQSRRARWLIIALVIFAVIALGFVAYWYLYASNYQETDDAYVAGDLVNVTSQVNGTVISIGADETDLVQAGQELVRLDSTDAEVALRDSEARLARAVRQTRTVFANRDQVEAVVAQRRSDLSKAQSDFNRRKDLTASGAVSEEELSHVRDTLQAAKDGLVAAEKSLSASLALTGQTGVPDNPDVRAAATDVEKAYLTLRRTSIKCPVSGYVARRNVQLVSGYRRAGSRCSQSCLWSGCASTPTSKRYSSVGCASGSQCGSLPICMAVTSSITVTLKGSAWVQARRSRCFLRRMQQATGSRSCSEYP
jgi:membrane fusion protein (multidrug efflux system)